MLYDDDRRKIYDETGSIEKLAAMTQEDLVQRYREMYKPVTIEAIEEECKRYVGSDDEKRDILEFIISHKGNVKHLTECITFSERDGLRRYKIIFRQLEQDGKIPANLLSAFKKSIPKMEQQVHRLEEEEAMAQVLN